MEDPCLQQNACIRNRLHTNKCGRTINCNPRIAVNLKNNWQIRFLYSSANAFDFTDGKNNCNKGSKCTFEFSVLSKRLVDSLESGGSDTGDPYKCGGFVYNVSRINGYVVVPDNIKYSGRSVKTSKDN